MVTTQHEEASLNYDVLKSARNVTNYPLFDPAITVGAGSHHMEHYLIGRAQIDDLLTYCEGRTLAILIPEFLRNYSLTLIDLETAHYRKTKTVIDFMKNLWESDTTLVSARNRIVLVELEMTQLPTKGQRCAHDYKEEEESPQQVVEHNYLTTIGDIVRTIQFSSELSLHGDGFWT